MPGHSPEAVHKHFYGNQALLEGLLGSERVRALGQERYEVTLAPKGAMGLSLRPRFVVAFEALGPQSIGMRCLDAQLAEASHQVADFEASFDGEASFAPSRDGGCWMTCRARLSVGLALPPPFCWMPEGPLVAVGEGVLRAGMGALAGRLPRILLHSMGGAPAVAPPA